MKKQFILTSMLAIGLLASCKNEPKDEPLPDEVTQEELVEVCNLIEVASPGEVISFEYDDNGLPSSINFDLYVFDCSYDDVTGETDCDSTLVEQELRFTLTDSLITKVDLLANGSPSDEVSLELSYTEDKKLSILSFNYSYDGGTDVDEYRLVYNANGQVIKVENYDNYSIDGSFRLYGYESFTYANDNIVEVNYYYENNTSAIDKSHKKLLPSINAPSYKHQTKGLMRSAVAGDLESTATMTYDDKINPFYDNIPFLLYSNGFNFYLSKNNVKTYTYTEIGDDSYTYSVDYTYEYNEQNFPSLMLVTSEDDGETMTAEATFDYSCK